jgi:lactoylglutathione lyase
MTYTLYLTPLTFIFQHMKIEHLAVWTNQLDVLKAFYIKFFNAIANEKYHNPRNQFSSYFLSFSDGARLELMQMPGIPDNRNDVMRQNTGLIHFAMSAGSKEKVDSLTEAIRKEGFTVTGEPRWTGDGYYESVILDPDNNRIEITI